MKKFEECDKKLVVGSVYKCKDDTQYLIIKDVTETVIEYIVADYRSCYCQIETSPLDELIEEIVDFELINYEL